jgi:hypothetical protein
MDNSLSPRQVLPWQSPEPNPSEVQAPSSPLKHQSQRIATTRYPVNDDAPVRNTQIRIQARSITQEAILACIHVHNDITSRPFMANQASRWQFPWEILHAVLNTITGALMEMRHLLVNPKYKELWGKSYTIELGCLAQGIPGIGTGTNTIVFIRQEDIPIDQQKDVTYGRMCINYCPEKAIPIALASPLAAIASPTLGIAVPPLLTWSRSKYTSTALSLQKVHTTAPSI